MRVLISDKISESAIEIFKQNKIIVDYKPGMTAQELEAIIDQYDGLAIRSSTKVTKEILEKGKNLKIVGRAGIGTDNIDKKAATQRGINCYEYAFWKLSNYCGTCYSTYDVIS